MIVGSLDAVVVQARKLASWLKTGTCLLAIGFLTLGIDVIGNRLIASRSSVDPQDNPPEASSQRGAVGKALMENLRQDNPPRAGAQASVGPKFLTANLTKDALPEGALARIGTTKFRVSSSICTVAFSPDGDLLACGTEDGEVHVCEAVTGKPVLVMELEKSRPVSELAFTPDGNSLVISGIWSSSVYLVDVKTQQVTQAIPNAGKDQERWSRFWQGPTFAFLPDRKTLLFGGKDGALHFWDIAAAKEVGTMHAVDAPVVSLTISANGQRALSAHRGGELHFWDLVGRKHLQKMDAALKKAHLTALSPNGKWFVLETGVGELEMRDWDGKPLQKIKTVGDIAGLGFLPDGSKLLVANKNGQLSTWHDVTGLQILEMRKCDGISISESSSLGTKPGAWFRSDAKKMVWGCGDLLRTWDLRTGKETPKGSDFIKGVRWAGFSADGKTVRVGGNSGELGVWDVATADQKSLSNFFELKNGIHFAPASDRGRVILVSDRNGLPRNVGPDAGRIFVWDPGVEDRLRPLTEQVTSAWNASLTPDNRFVIATEVDAQIRVYDAATGKLVRSFAGRNNEYHPTFSPDGALVATCGGNWEIRLYEFASGRLLREWKENSPASEALAFSPDGKTLASGHSSMGRLNLPGRPGLGDISKIYLWDVQSGKKVLQIQTAHGIIGSVSFSPDGRLIASSGRGSPQQPECIWETESGQLRRTFVGHSKTIWNVEFSPEGRRLVSASSDGTAIIWRLFEPGADLNGKDDVVGLWNDLPKQGLVAHRAMGSLIKAPGTPEFLGKRLKAATRESTDVQPELLRELRGIEILEHIDGEVCRRKLRELAMGAPNARQTIQAKASLARLERKQ